MSDVYEKAQRDRASDHRERARIGRVLDLLNAEPTAELLTSRLEEVSGDERLAKLGPALHAHRSRIGSYQDVEDLQAVEGVSSAVITTLVNRVNLPHFQFETEKLQLVHWTHGSELVIDNPEHFGTIQRRRDGIRITSLRRGTSGPLEIGTSWVHMSIPAPAFQAEGKQFQVGSVLFNFHSSPAAFGFMGAPLATPYEIEVWDGHRRIATERVSPLSNATNRYLRVPVQARQKILYGLRVSCLLFVRSVSEASELSFSIDIGAVGVELVTRSGLVISEVNPGFG